MSRFLRPWSIISAFLAFGLSLFAQQSPAPHATGQMQVMQQPLSGQLPPARTENLGDVARQYREKKRAEIKMTAQDTRELFHSIDKILQFASDDSGFAARATVGRQMLGQEDVERQVRANMADDKSVQRMENAQLTLKKFGLLPRDFEIRKLAASVAGENIAAFYDPKKKTINMMNWIPVAQQRPVLAHELTHALQDQNYNLDRWMGWDQKDKVETAPHDSADGDMDRGEQMGARKAVVE